MSTKKFGLDPRVLLPVVCLVVRLGRPQQQPTVYRRVVALLYYYLLLLGLVPRLVELGDGVLRSALRQRQVAPLQVLSDLPVFLLVLGVIDWTHALLHQFGRTLVLCIRIALSIVQLEVVLLYPLRKLLAFCLELLLFLFQLLGRAENAQELGFAFALL